MTFCTNSFDFWRLKWTFLILTSHKNSTAISFPIHHSEKYGTRYDTRTLQKTQHPRTFCSRLINRFTGSQSAFPPPDRSVRFIILVNVLAGCCSFHGLLGPLLRRFNLIFTLATKNKRNRGLLWEGAWQWVQTLGAVTTEDECIKKGRVLHPCRFLLLALSSQQS